MVSFMQEVTVKPPITPLLLPISDDIAQKSGIRRGLIGGFTVSFMQEVTVKPPITPLLLPIYDDIVQKSGHRKGAYWRFYS